MTLINKLRPKRTQEPSSHPPPPPPPAQEPQQAQAQQLQLQLQLQHRPHQLPQQSQEQTLLPPLAQIEIRYPASIHQTPSLMPTSHRPINIAELDKTPAFFWAYPTIVKTKRHGTVTVHSPQHMAALITWYRFQSGEYRRGEMEGLPSRLDVTKPTRKREEYDGGWNVDLSLRQRETRDGVEEEEEQEQEKKNEKEGSGNGDEEGQGEKETIGEK